MLIVGRGRKRAFPLSEAHKVEALRRYLADKNGILLKHRYFDLCRTRSLSRAEVIEIVKQLYCFSVFFERLLTGRIAFYSSRSDQSILRMARRHLREEFGHAELFLQCLLANGLSAVEAANVTPRMFTKSLFGYLLATVLHENEYVTNVAIMQVMESIGLHFFRATLPVLEARSMLADALRKHTEDDEEHAQFGIELAAGFDDQTAADCRRVIDDLYRLMGHVLDEWLGGPVADRGRGPERLRLMTRSRSARA
jgi:hypothetical protein